MVKRQGPSPVRFDLAEIFRRESRCAGRAYRVLYIVHHNQVKRKRFLHYPRERQK
jgi:hypothetical protein